MAANYVTIRKAAENTGYTEDAIRAKCERGTWKEGEVWVRAPDGRVLISMDGYDTWVETGLGCALPPVAQSKSPSPIRVNSAGRGSKRSPPPLT